MNNANTRLKTQVFCLYLSCITYLLFVCSTRGFCFTCSATRQDGVSSIIAAHTRFISEKLTALLAVCHAYSTRVITPFPLGSGTKCKAIVGFNGIYYAHVSVLLKYCCIRCEEIYFQLMILRIFSFLACVYTCVSVVIIFLLPAWFVFIHLMWFSSFHCIVVKYCCIHC